MASSIPEWPGQDLARASKEVPAGAKNMADAAVREIVNPLIGLIFAAALVYFLWGVFTFFLSVSADAKKTEGKSHMLWGIVGMAVMVVVYALIQFGLAFFGFERSI